MSKIFDPGFSNNTKIAIEGAQNGNYVDYFLGVNI